jgi:hypothetical protein
MDPNCKPVHAIARSVDVGVIKEYFSSEWASCSSTFAISKKNGTIRVITNFKKLNLLLKHHLILTLKIEDVIGLVYL